MSYIIERTIGFAAAFAIAAALTWHAGAQTAQTPPAVAQPKLGTASVVANSLSGRHMANGERFHSTGNAAASRDLPLGTRAQVTNLKTGKSAIVTIKDRGPFADGRTVDVSRATANQIGITRKTGVAPVKVTPVALPATSPAR